MKTIKYSENSVLFTNGANYSEVIRITKIIDLDGNKWNLPANKTVVIDGGYVINSDENTAATLNLNGCRVIGGYDKLLGSGAGTVNVTNIGEGTQSWDSTNKKPTWWNGTAWVDATGTPV